MKKYSFWFVSMVFFAFVFFGLPSYSSQWRSYLVKKNDYVLKILAKHQLYPLRGKSGSLAKTIELNPALVRRHGDLIYPNQTILLPLLDNETKLVKADSCVDESAMVPNRSVASERVPTGEDLARLSMTVGTGFMSVAGTDTSNFSGTTDTQSYVLTHLAYRQYWNDAKLASDFTIGLHSLKLASPLGATHSQSDFTLVSFGVGFDKVLGDDFGLLFGLRSDPIFFVSSRTGQTLNTTSASIGTFNLGLRKTLMSYKNLSSELALNFLATIPQKTAIQLYSGWGGQLDWRNEYRSGQWGIVGNAQFLKRKINADVQKLDQSVISVALGVSYYFSDR